MNKEAWWWVLAVVVVAGIGYWTVSGKDVAKDQMLQEEPQAEEAGDAVETGDTSILWEFGIKDAGTGTMMREVSITYKGVKRVVGTYPGACSIVEDSSWPLLENELTGVICWFAGAGTEVGVFYEDGVRVVKVGSLEEGTAETEGSRGGFETAFALD